MAQMLLVNPAKRRTKRKARSKTPSIRRRARAKVASVKTTVRKYRRNPSPRGLNGAMDTMKDGAIGAAGAVATEVLLSKIPLPPNLMSGNAKTAVSALASVGVGMLVSKYGNRAMGKKMAQGGVTVALHTIMRSAVAGPAGLPVMNSAVAGTDDFVGYFDEGVGYFDEGVGFVDSAPTFNGDSTY